MKRIIFLLLILMLMLPLSGCREVDKSNNNDNNNGKDKINAEEFFAVDNKQCSIKIKETYPDDKSGFMLTLEFENKSKDKTYFFYIHNASVNGLQCNPYSSLELAAGEKDDIDVYLPIDKQAKKNIGDFTDIAITFQVNDTADWNAAPIVFETIHIYPYGEDKVSKYVREPQPNDIIIMDNEFATVIVTGYIPGGDYGYAINLFCVNKTSHLMMFSTYGTIINGTMTDISYLAYIYPDNCGFNQMILYTDSLKSIGITDVKTITFELQIHKIDGDNYDLYASEIITLEP